VAVHALFSDESYQSLREVVSRIATTNTVLHETNAIDIAPLFTNSIVDLLSGPMSLAATNVAPADP
jgi:ribose-phosphate pyrophosphokinase